jgi:hypothetical protein
MFQRSITSSPFQSMCRFLLTTFLCSLVACDFVPEKVTWDDPRLVSMQKAIEAVDRNSLGFTPIQKSAAVRLENRPRAQYDAMLHIEGNSSRTIAFRKIGKDYKWIGEQEIFSGPNKYKTVDGIFNEEIVVTYETESVSGHEPNKLHIEYIGDDSQLIGSNRLSLKQAQQKIEEWKIRR